MSFHMTCVRRAYLVICRIERNMRGCRGGRGGRGWGGGHGVILSYYEHAALQGRGIAIARYLFPMESGGSASRKLIVGWRFHGKRA